MSSSVGKIATLLLCIFVNHKCSADNRVANSGKNDISRPFAELLDDIPKWQSAPEREHAIRDAILSSGTNGFATLLKYLGREGYPAGDSLDTRAITLTNRKYASIAIWMMGQRAKPILPDLLELAKDRGWNGREQLVRSIASFREPSEAIVGMGLIDIQSADTQTRLQGVLVLIGQSVEKARDAMIRETTDSDPIIRDNAIYGLLPLTSDPVVKLFLQKLSTNKSATLNDRSRAKTVLHPELIHGDGKPGVRG